MAGAGGGGGGDGLYADSDLAPQKDVIPTLSKAKGGGIWRAVPENPPFSALRGQVTFLAISASYRLKKSALRGTKVILAPPSRCYMLRKLFSQGGVMELTILIVGLLVVGSQIRGNPHIMLR
jgi:hypothetical protein